MRWLRSLVTFVVLIFGFVMWAEEADARLARESRFADAEQAIGFSRLTVEAREEEISPCNAQSVYHAGSLGDLFSRPGLIGGFAAGFLGAGVFGVLFGHGVIGELSGLPSILGLLAQVALLFTLGWLIWAWWRADKAAAVAKLTPRQLADAYGRSRNEALPDVGAPANAKADGKNSFADKAHLPL